VSRLDALKTEVLYQGDNLGILRTRVPDNSVDLIYLDPPFGSSRDYHLSVPENGERPAKAFSDNWKWDGTSDNLLRQIRHDAPEGLAKLIEGMAESIGKTSILTYLVMMAPRLLEMHRVLRETGSIYLHCDPTSSHYLKLVLDRIFGAKNFRNEIIWMYKGGGRSKKAFARKHDVIFFYSMSGKWTFNYQDILVDRTNKTYFTDEDGRRYWLKYGKKYYLQHDGKVPEDCWADIDPLHGPYNERLGYPTQKPLSLLERIIKASSNEEDIVLDPFCGCGTTLVAAQSLNRRWLGMDVSTDAIELSSKRLEDTFPGIDFETVDCPPSLF
jgi:site-specific DNA-methyltransferase (adenine-specific)